MITNAKKCLQICKNCSKTSGLLLSNPEVMVRNNDRVPVYGSFTVLVTFITAFVRRIMPEPLCLWGLQLTGPVRQSASTHMG